MFWRRRTFTKATLHLGLLFLAALLSMGSGKKMFKKLGRTMSRATKRMKKRSFKRRGRFKKRFRKRRTRRFARRFRKRRTRRFSKRRTRRFGKRRTRRFNKRRGRRNRRHARRSRRRHRRYAKRHRRRTRRRHRRHARRDKRRARRHRRRQHARRDRRDDNRDRRQDRRDYKGCPGNSVRQGNKCSCPSGSTWSNADFNCVEGVAAAGACSGGAVRDGATCKCPAGKQWDDSSKACMTERLVNGCPGGTVRTGNKCECPQGKKWNDTTRLCEDPQAPKVCSGGAVKTGNKCECPQGKKWNDTTRHCEAVASKRCPSGQRWHKRRRRCIPGTPGHVSRAIACNTRTGRCVQQEFFNNFPQGSQEAAIKKCTAQNRSRCIFVGFCRKVGAGAVGARKSGSTYSFNVMVCGETSRNAQALALRKCGGGYPLCSTPALWGPRHPRGGSSGGGTAGRGNNGRGGANNRGGRNGNGGGTNTPPRRQAKKKAYTEQEAEAIAFCWYGKRKSFDLNAKVWRCHGPLQRTYGSDHIATALSLSGCPKGDWRNRRYSHSASGHTGFVVFCNRIRWDSSGANIKVGPKYSVPHTLMRRRKRYMCRKNATQEKHCKIRGTMP